MTTLALSIAPPRERVGARLVFQAAAAVAGSLLVAGLAQLSIYLPFTPVPITGQTLGVKGQHERVPVNTRRPGPLRTRRSSC